MSSTAFDSFARILLGRNPPTSALHPISRQRLPTTITPTEALRCGTVYSCVSIISRAISEVRFKAPKDRQLNAILARPNLYQSRKDYVFATVWDLLLHGESMTRIDGGASDPVLMASMDPDRIHISIDRNTRRPLYRDTYDATDIPADEVMRLRDAPTNSLAGVSRVNAYASKIHALIAADQLMLNTFLNGISIGYTLNASGPLSDTQFDRLKKLLKTFMSKNVRTDDGDGKDSQQGGFLILEDGVQLEKFDGLTPAEAETLDARNQLKVEIAAGWDLPPFLVGGPSDSKYNNMSARIATTYKQAFSPMIENLADGLDHRFGTPIEANDEVLQKGDFASQVITSIGLISNGVWTPNETRDRIFGMPPVPDGDKLRWQPANAGTNGRHNRVGEFPSDDGTAGSAPPER